MKRTKDYYITAMALHNSVSKKDFDNIVAMLHYLPYTLAELKAAYEKDEGESICGKLKKVHTLYY